MGTTSTPPEGSDATAGTDPAPGAASPAPTVGGEVDLAGDGERPTSAAVLRVRRERPGDEAEPRG